MSAYIKHIVFILLGAIIFSCSKTNIKENTAASSQQVNTHKIKEITADTLSESALENYLVIDVRELEELEEGVIPNSVHIPMGEIATKLPAYLQSNFKNQNLDELKNKPVLLYCRGGVRSYRSAETLKKLGFTNLTSLDGGFNAYKAKSN